ncbi:uncharacterized protein [Haliotis asinina]|uniref:uncharacterized protein n=1 Tax=Haliotis asinina TaxID=109174 RepID=UPI0035323480
MGTVFSSDETEKEKIQKQRHKYIESRLKRDKTVINKTQRDKHNAEAGNSNIANGGTNRPGIDRSGSSLDEVDHKASCIDPKDYEFPFENIVFEGGGNKGLAHCGALKYLEEIGALPKIRRMAGASAGAMVACLVAVGYRWYEIEDFLGQNLADIFLDHTCGYCSLLPNLLKNYGWNPGMKIYEWFGTKIKDKTGTADITFEQLRSRFGRELCVVVTNLNLMNTEYCHPKTTPDMPVRLAVRMSMSIPGMFTATKYTLYGETDLFVDGGILCNYPIHCFDGWYLSMAQGDSFIQRLQPLSDLPRLFDRKNRFGDYNKKTLGLLLYADTERDVLRYTLEKRIGVLSPERPAADTKLYIQRMKKQKDIEKAEREHCRVVRAVDAFLKVLKKHNLDDNDVIERMELEDAFKDEEAFPRSEAEILFGEDVDVQKAFEILDQDGNGQIKYNELVTFIEEHGICLQTRFLGYQRKEVKNLFTFLDCLQSTLLTNVKRIYVEERDIGRTVGINTGHVGTSDFILEEEDREFVVQRGYNSCRAFLQYFVVENNPPMKTTEQISEDGDADNDQNNDVNNVEFEFKAEETVIIDKDEKEKLLLGDT